MHYLYLYYYVYSGKILILTLTKMKSINKIKLNLSLLNTIEYLSAYWAVDDLPDDDELLFLQEKAEQRGKRETEGYWNQINWELYQGDKLVAYRKPVQGGVTKYYEGIWRWEHDFVLEVEHTGSKIIDYNKK